MYWEQTAVVRTEHDITEEFKIKIRGQAGMCFVT